ncbi:RagB/SusD family nutrient uptake outer membrane protein [Chryseobacterium sp. PMSZPI]|uniref:RagB/SusD family nutrient uptake outer membrane protein n=1 Tax=Chryseobacterium sp. PMSZPI TaxID=1033900 RepID=UPI000C336E32|nr:RagB/SusD family nutrient uptake outer membrane protein [Chryseobacterium sp. PMSZPI]PKF75450.1 RagB/SusD family nutrient uptake outer membrane protein [Chryseobacterium sp. PMSZPI]
MKKIKYLIYGVAIAFSLSSCKDAIDIVQDGELTEQVALQKVSDLRSFLNGNIYVSFDTGNEIQLTSAFTDEVGITPGNSGWYFAEHRYILNSATGQVAGIWTNSYLTINRVNRLLRAATTITPKTGEEAEYNSILAEARTLRALAYLRLESYFTTNMADDSALGVIWVEGVPQIDAQLPRISNGEIYAKIESDLNFAEANLKSGNTYYFVTKNLINAIRARMYAYREKYTLAKQYAQAVINGGYTLAAATPMPANPGSASFNTSFYSASTTNPYRKMWADAAQGEIIFALSRPSAGSWGNVANLFTTNTTDLNGSPLLDMGRNLFNLMDPTYDVRRWAFIDPTSLVSATYDTDPDYRFTDVLVIDKYPGKGNTPLRNDMKVFRLSEMYMILAEAAVAENNLPEAAANVKKVRDARRFAGTAPALSYSTQQEAYRDILKERRVEFCFEGFRYVDLRRLGKATKANVSIDRNHTDDIVDTPLTLSITDYRWTMPIPQTEVLGNPSIVQNPGY